ncbi:helix-turn-helix domain-containing protein [Streptomyces sp. NPDC055099]
MALRLHITERQRRLGIELRKLRESAGLNLIEAAALIDMGRPHLTHIEAARTGISTERLRTLVGKYGCTSGPYIDELVRMSESNGKGWWTGFRKVLPQRSLDLAELEGRATRIQGYETLVIPGLLQTEAYMRALFRDSLSAATADEVDALVQFRLQRQSALADPQRANLHVVIHEAALRLVVGSSHIMRGQLTHLLTAARMPNLTIQVRPFDAGSALWIGASFSILSPGVPGLETVAVEHPSAQLKLSDQASLDQYSSTFAELSKNSLPPVVTDHPPDAHTGRDSCVLLQHLLYTYQGSSHD